MGGVSHPDVEHSRTSTSFGQSALCLSCLPVASLQGVHGVQLSPHSASAPAGERQKPKLIMEKSTGFTEALACMTVAALVARFPFSPRCLLN